MSQVAPAVARDPIVAPVTRADRVLLLGTLLLAVALLAGGFWRWPWDHDEVLSLAEVGAVAPDRYPGPAVQVRKIGLILPVWYYLQHGMLRVFPSNEFGARVLPVGAAVVLVALSAWWARRRGVRFASAVVLLAGCSPMLVWLAQQNRFYSLALCFLAAALFMAGSRLRSPGADVAAVVLALAALLTHNLTLVVFGLAFVTAVIVHWWGPARPALVRRTALMAAACSVVYVLYLRPLLAGWMSGGTGGTQPLVSYLAQFGLGPAGLLALGSVAILVDEDERDMRWWLLLAAASLAFVAVAPVLLRAWNPRYALFFMWAAWVVAARGAAFIADRLERGVLRTAWYLAVLSLVAPKLLSHMVDGTRHDFRSAAGIVAAQAPSAVASNWPATLQYYLEEARPGTVTDWQPGGPLPTGPLVLVFASNAWEPMLRLSDREVSLVAQVGRRRFDEQSHVIRIYRVGPPLPDPLVQRP